MLNLDYHPILRIVGSIIKRHLPILYKSVAMKETFNPDKTRIMIGFRCHKNLNPILPGGGEGKIRPLLFFLHHPKTAPRYQDETF